MCNIDGSADTVASTVVRRIEGISIDWDGIMCIGKASEGGKGVRKESRLVIIDLSLCWGTEGWAKGGRGERGVR